MLKICNISKSFDGKSILNQISFEAKIGELTVLRGKNGAGKSTLFNIVAGLIPEDEGEIWLNGVQLGTMPASLRACSIAILKQDPKTSSVLTMTVMENMVLASLKGRRASLFSTKKEINQFIEDHVEKLKLTESINMASAVKDLSGGQRQLVAFAMATLHKPHLLLLDEPTAALDEASCHRLMALVKRLISDWQIPALMISHDGELTQTYGDQFLKLQDGAIV
jgi:putative ABC transport system ATP-binding protein